MKQLLWATTALTISASAAFASGPQLYTETVVETVAMTTPAPWQGLYFGGSLGFGASNYDLGGTYAAPTPPLNVDLNLPDLGGEGAFVGLQAGYNHQMSDRIVVGLQLDGTFTGITNDTALNATLGTDTLSATYDLSPSTIYTLAARVGYLTSPDTMVYGLLGYSRANYSGDLNVSINGTSVFADDYSFSMDGAAIGVGMETRLSARTTLGVEYRYNHMGRYELYNGPLGLAASDTLNAGFDASIHTARVFLNYSF